MPLVWYDASHFLYVILKRIVKKSLKKCVHTLLEGPVKGMTAAKHPLLPVLYDKFTPQAFLKSQLFSKNINKFSQKKKNMLAGFTRIINEYKENEVPICLPSRFSSVKVTLNLPNKFEFSKKISPWWGNMHFTLHPTWIRLILLLSNEQIALSCNSKGFFSQGRRISATVSPAPNYNPGICTLSVLVPKLNNMKWLNILLGWDMRSSMSTFFRGNGRMTGWIDVYCVPTHY